MKKMIRAEIKKISKIHLAQTARQMYKGAEREKKLRQYFFKKDLLKIPFI